MPSKNKKGKSKNAAVAVHHVAVGVEKPSNRKRKNRVPDAAVQQDAVQEEVDRPSVGIEGIEEASETQGGARKRSKTTTSFTEADKEEIIEFLMRNEVLYSKRLAGFKDVSKKEDLWAAQAAKMNTTVSELRIWYTSMRTMLGRLKKRKCRKCEITLFPHQATRHNRHPQSFLIATEINGRM